MKAASTTPNRPQYTPQPTFTESPSMKSVLVSPGRSPSTGGNLTGVSRKIKDSAADWHKYTGKWKEQERLGEDAIRNIFNLKFSDKTNTLGSQLVDEDEETDSFSQGKSFPEPMEEHTDTLLDIHAKMTKIVEKLGQITKNLRGISELEWNQNDKSFCSEPLFGTWHTNEFYEASDKLVAMYKKELALKLTIVQNIAHTTDQDLARTMVYAWTHEPYIDERATMILETLFLETGLRK